MGKYGFWILLGCCLAAIAAVYAIEVRKSADELRATVETSHGRAALARETAKVAVGRSALEGLKEAQARTRAQVDDLHQFFVDRDDQNLDCWFPDLRLPWRTAPKPEPFLREYQLSQDRLARELLRLLVDAGAPDAPVPLIDPGPLDPKDYPDAKALGAEMRRRQREFWIQDHLLLAFARYGAWPARTIRHGEAIGATGASPFERLRYDVQVWADPTRVSEVLHAFDSPFVHVTEDGQRIDIAINAVVDNVSIRPAEPDEKTLATFKDRLPVLVSFYLTILDYDPKARG
ncbi:MAG: hypothetical protein H6807_05705 [Planctomycetes bacterium]|nr:hypothetical protein [Planctomycetota bacterium]